MNICTINVNDIDILHYFGYDKIINSNENILNNLFDNFLEFQKTEQNNLMETIATILGENVRYGIYTDTIYETFDLLYQMVYIDVNDNDAKILCKKDEQVLDIKNMCCCYLSSEKKNIHGKCVLLKFDCKNKQFNLTNILQTDVYDVLYKKIVHTCVFLEENGDMKNIRFIMSPCEGKDNHEIHYQNMGDIYLLIYYTNKSKNINKKISKLCEIQICGDVYVCLYNCGNTFINLDTFIFEKLLTLKNINNYTSYRSLLDGIYYNK